ncbi:MAG: molybdenum cofactor guanylyltransferase [Acidimicrobiales bacterium]|nr:molybdenum cofactor guanylyltransferase [Acidimicrobiales bacterium]
MVLAGGGARRMGGVDKAMLEIAGATMLDRVIAAVAPHCDEVVVVGPRRPTALADVRFTTEEAPGGGPVPGVAAGLAEVADADTVLVVAVDLPLLTVDDVSLLLEGLDDAAVDAVAALDHRGRPNPLLAAYRAAPLRGLLARLESGSPAARMLPASNATVDLGEGATLNVNDPADLQRARQRLRHGP